MTSPPPQPVTTAPPKVTSLRQSVSRWREGRKPARLGARRKVSIGTTFSFVLSEQASVRLSFLQAAAGRRVAGRCVAKTKSNARHRRCTLSRGAISLAGHAGPNRVFFQGRLTSHKSLPLGSYTMTVTAADAAGLRSSPQSLRFTIVR